MINNEIAQFIVAIEILFAILCLTFLLILHSTLSFHLNKIFCLINFVSTNSQRKILFLIIKRNYLFSLKKLKFPELRFSGT